ncbi:hypothetical protein ACS0TY_026155 [Phlomoides rotata]
MENASTEEFEQMMKKLHEIGEEDPLLEKLEQQNNWDGVPMCLYDGFWYPIFVLRGLLSSGEHFEAHDTDFVLASQPKTGTTWMKALLFSIINRNRFPIQESPLLTTSPHKLVDPLECFYYFLLLEKPDVQPGASESPRLYSTHLPYQHLPTSLTNSKCKIVYITRNPLDQFISEHKFLLKIRMRPDSEPLPIGQAFDMFCKGVHAFGPFWDHFLGYWNASLENPNRILFLKYEDLKMDPVSNLDKIAHFLGRPFTEEERESGLMQEILNMCSFDNLKHLEVNKTGVHAGSIINDSFYRKGDIGDWKNHLTPSMAQSLKQKMTDKMTASGFNLDTFFKL